MAPAGATLATALAALLLGAVEGQTYVGPEYIPAAEHPVPMWLNPPKQAQVASCAIDVGISLVFLGRAGTSINNAIISCEKQIAEKDKAACSASVSGVVAGFVYAAGFLQQAAADCQSSFQVISPAAAAKAACGADITNFIASMALLANAGSAVRNVCAQDHQRVARGSDIINRRLQEDGNSSHFHKLGATWRVSNITGIQQVQRELDTIRISGSKKHKKLDITRRAPGQPSDQTLRDRGAEITECVFDIGQATMFLARAAVMINAAVSDCTRFEIRTGGQGSRARCAADVSSVMSAFAFTASGISYAAHNCPFWTTLAPACAGAISNMIAALSQIAASSASFQGTCGFVGRRLSGATEQQPGILV